MKVGFNNLNVSFESLCTEVRENTSLNDHILFAVGKVEWDQIRWEQAAAQKRNLINSVDAVFTAAPDRESFRRSRGSLQEAQVNSRLLDCSDAHHWTSSSEANRLGATLTWVNADPTFKGLRQALQEYEHRITIEDRPAIRERLAQSPQAVISEIAIRPCDASERSTLPLFNVSMPVNPGFCVIIGNKGQGKSALLDAVALAASSDRQSDFSFLSPERFRSGGGSVAKLYEVELAWADGQGSTVNLNAPADTRMPVLVDYLPQSLVEKVCSSDPDSIEKRQFESEIERVVFRHLDDSTRGSASTLPRLLEAQGVAEKQSLADGRAEVGAAAAEIMALERRCLELESMGLERRLAALDAKITRIDEEIAAVDSLLASTGSLAQQAEALALATASSEQEAVQKEVTAVRSAHAELLEKIDTAEDTRCALENAIDEALRLAGELGGHIGVTISLLLQINYQPAVFDAWRTTTAAAAASLSSSIAAGGEMGERLRIAELEVIRLQEALESTGAETQVLLQRKADLAVQKRDLLGDISEPESSRGIGALLAEHRALPDRISTANSRLKGGFAGVHLALVKLMDNQKSAYAPATSFVESDPLAASVDLVFDVEFRVRDLGVRLLPMVNRQKLGDFYDLDHPDCDKQLLAGVDLEDGSQLIDSLQRLVVRLRTDRGSAVGPPRSLDSIMRSAHSSADRVPAKSWCRAVTWGFVG